MKMMTRAAVVVVMLLAVLAVATLAVNAQGGGLPVASLSCEQYLRSQPTIDAPPEAVMFADEPMMLVTGRDLSGSWFVVLRQNGQTGWVNGSDCLNIQGEIANAPLTRPAVYDGPPIATVACTQFVRSEPSNDAAPLLILYPEDGVLEVTGRDETDTGWLLVRRADGEMGWTYNTPCIKVQGDVLDAPTADVVMPVPNEDGTLPATPIPGVPTATIGCTQYVRAAPDVSSPALIILYPDDGLLNILGVDPDDPSWLLVQRADGAMGWVSDSECIRVLGDLGDAPYAIDVIMPVPGISEGSIGMILYPDQLPGETRPTWTVPEPYVQLACSNYVRSAANNDSARLAIFYPGEGPLEILARDQPAAWLLVRRWDGAMGWVVNTECINVVGNVFDIVEDTSVVMPIPGITNGNMDGVAELLENSEATGFAVPVAATPIPLPPEPYARLSCPNYIRSAASNEAARLTIVYPGEGPLEIIARDQPAAWLLVKWAGGMGWTVNTECVNVTGNVFEAPHDTSAEMVIPTPEPTATPVTFGG